MTAKGHVENLAPTCSSTEMQPRRVKSACMRALQFLINSIQVSTHLLHICCKVFCRQRWTGLQPVPHPTAALWDMNMHYRFLVGASQLLFCKSAASLETLQSVAFGFAFASNPDCDIHQVEDISLISARLTELQTSHFIAHNPGTDLPMHLWVAVRR